MLFLRWNFVEKIIFISLNLGSILEKIIEIIMFTNWMREIP